MKLQFDFEPDMSAKIKVIGVGGAGGNAVNRMIESGFIGVDFVAINTDAQALGCSLAQNQIQIGSKLTHGLGSGGNPDVGRKAVDEDGEKIAAVLKGADMVFIAAGMGGGTGTGAGPAIAKMAKQIGALVVAVATKPFLFEGQYRMRQAVEGLRGLKQEVDTAIVIPNQRLLAVASKNTPVREAFRIADDVLLRATRGVSDLITVPGLVNLDFADVKSVMTEMGDAVMGTGVSSGKNRAVEAAQQAISSPLLEDASIAGAGGVLVNVTGGADLTLHEINEAAMVINDAIGAETNMIFGAVVDDSLKDQTMITVIATGIRGAVRKAERDAPRDKKPVTMKLTPREPEVRVPVRQRTEPVINAPARQHPEPAVNARLRRGPEPEPEQRGVMYAKDQRRNSRRELEIPTFLRRQMD
ncbi:MAG: cell division protein FtsZ [Candidatus Eisenbacteria bacterium]|nr:cell division protein FtsZ [Candidatus Eisenbacteria bacterium]